MNTSLERREPLRETYRDELNFAEFPLASLSNSLPKDQKTLEFTDEIFDQSRNERVTRKLTITASDKYGLPTAMDDEVILGLIQLTGREDFADRRVFFTRYELLKLLNWSDDSRNYKRLEQSLNRWLGVTLYYDKSWWSKEEQSWVNEGFHILDHVAILDRERQRKASVKNANSGRSSFVWNEIVFNSFKAGYLKQIDFAFYKRLESAVSKRMYRFLDKRFYHRQRLEFALRTFACEHIGLSKKYHNGELKRVLTPAIAELEAEGFLKVLSANERFLRKGRGEWTVVFVGREKSRREPETDTPILVKELVVRGMSRASAHVLVTQSEETKIRQKLEFFDWLVSRKDRRIQRSPAGFLHRAIVEDFSLPDDYLASQRNEGVTSVKVAPISKRQNAKAAAPQPSVDSSKRLVIDQYWNALSLDEQERIEQTLAETAPKFHREHYLAGRKERGPLFRVVRQLMIDQHVETILAASNDAGGRIMTDRDA